MFPDVKLRLLTIKSAEVIIWSAGKTPLAPLGGRTIREPFGIYFYSYYIDNPL